MNRSFASDNYAPVAPEILAALGEANHGDAPAYGGDPWTRRAIERFRAEFGAATDVYFTFNGTGANVVALAALLRPWQSALVPASAHLQTDECAAFERFTGSKMIPIPTADGKLRRADLEPYVQGAGVVHFPQPRVVSISQATEYGGLYEPAEIRTLCEFAHAHGLAVHVDGARLANAAAALETTLRALTVDLGVDVLTFGGTKNGLMFGEAICFFDPGLHAGAAGYVRKQAMQLASKMRYVAAQFDRLLDTELWRSHAAHSNAMAAELLERVRRIEGIAVTRPAPCNAIFATMERGAIERARAEFDFYTFDELRPEVRWMTHWATQEGDVEAFASCLRRAVAG
ncbi:MAG TPA: beta-eliminating lyase-related protein [Candidatus Acidoferrales bacterium]|nr:beta-eliminating lyase-related protein [Candidatus Acidoferrales bacterium]